MIDGKRYVAGTISILICAALVLLVVAIVALCGGAIMTFFGFRYDSVWSILLFFIIVMLISYPFEMLAGALPRVLLALDKLSKPLAILLYLVLDILVTYVAFSFVDSVMDSVSTTPLSLFVLAGILALFGIRDVSRKPKILERRKEIGEWEDTEK